MKKCYVNQVRLIDKEFVILSILCVNLSIPKVLDLHENKLTSLPDDIGQLPSLQVTRLCIFVPWFAVWVFVFVFYCCCNHTDSDADPLGVKCRK